MIGITFFLMLLLVGAWAYTDVLAELARGMAGNLAARSLLVFALFAGAMLGGYTAGRLPQHAGYRSRNSRKCFAGGVLMGWGSLLIPGGNDGLILVGHAAAVAVRVGRVPDDVRRRSASRAGRRAQPRRATAAEQAVH